MKKIKFFLKLILISFGVIGIILAIVYVTVPQVKDKVNTIVVNIIDKIADVLPGEYKKLEELDVVTNIAFNEKTRTLTFDENLKAKEYVIVVNHKGVEGYQMTTQIGKVAIDPYNTLNDGDVIRFTVTARGDYVTTKNSKEAYFEHVLEHENEAVYSVAKRAFNEFMIKSIQDVNNFRAKSLDAKVFNLIGDNLIFEGVGKSSIGRDINFSIEYDLTQYMKNNSIDFTSLNNYKDLIVYINQNSSKNITVKAEYADGYVDLTNLLEEKGAFDEYINAGYQIEVLQHSNTAVMREDGVNYVSYTGIYKAAHESKPTVIFKQENRITVKNDKSYETVLELIEDAKANLVVTKEAKEIYDKVLNDHLANMLNVGA